MTNSLVIRDLSVSLFFSFHPHFSDFFFLQLVELYTSGQFWKDRRPALPQHSNEYAWHLLRSFGLGHIYEKRKGSVNDLCNACGVEVDFELINETKKADSLITIWALAKEEAEKRHADKFGNKLTASLHSAEEMLNTIKKKEEELRRKSPLSPSDIPPMDHSGLGCVDNEKFLQEIKCPTLILHSPDDGKVPFSYHATHANKHIPNATMEVSTTIIFIFQNCPNILCPNLTVFQLVPYFSPFNLRYSIFSIFSSADIRGLSLYSPTQRPKASRISNC